MIRLYVYDFDDTLSLTEEAGFHLENMVAGKLGHPPMSRKLHQETWGMFQAEAASVRFPGVDVSRFMDLMSKYYPIWAQEGKVDVITQHTMAVLEKVKKLGKESAILTSRQKKEINHLLDKNHPLQKYVQKFYYLDNTRYAKPDSRVFDHVLADFKVKPCEAVYVGDSTGDAISSKGAGLFCVILLESGLRKKSDFDGMGVDFFVDDFSQIVSLVDELDKLSDQALSAA